MAENTNICNPLQYLLEVDEQNTWVVRDIAAPSSDIIILLLQKDKESQIAIYQTDRKGFQHKEYICQHVEWTDSPLRLSSIYVEDSLNTLICTEKQLISYDNAKLAIRESVPLSERPMAIFVDRSNIFVSAAKTNKITVFNPSLHKENEYKMTCIGTSESLTDMVVIIKNMYACATNGKAFWYNLSIKEKKMEYRNRRTQTSMAQSITLYKGQRMEHRLVLVNWSGNEVHVYSSNSGHTLFAIDLNSSKKIRLTTTNQLIVVEAQNAAIYDMKKIIDRGIFLSIFVSSTTPKFHKVMFHNSSWTKNYESPTRQQDQKPRRSEYPVPGTFHFYREQVTELYEMYERSLEDYTEIAKSIEEKDMAIDELQAQLKERESEICGFQKTLDEDSLQVENEELNMLRSTNMALETKVQETVEKLKLQEIKTEVVMNMFSTIQTDLKEVNNNTSELLQETKGKATVAGELKKTHLAKPRRQRKHIRRSGADSGMGSNLRPETVKEAMWLFNELGENTYRRAVNLQSSKTITEVGGLVKIKGTDVSLLVPPGELLEDCEIHIQIITGNLDTGDDVTFASNSAAIVELTPNNFEFQNAVELHLPHCLQLKENFTNDSVEIFTSHHDTQAPPHWERETEIKFELQEEICKIYLKKFCWVTLRINNEIVEAKRLKIFTVGSKVIDTDNESTVNVGYFADVPGNEDIFLDENVTVGQYKPFWFKKEEPTPLVIYLKYLTPREWTRATYGIRKEISYQDIASSTNGSCAFVLHCNRSVRRSGVPYATFRVYRQKDSTNISFRPKMWNDLSEDEDS